MASEGTRGHNLWLIGFGLLALSVGVVHVVNTATAPVAACNSDPDWLDRCNRAHQRYHLTCDSPASCRGPEYLETGTCRETIARAGINLACVALRTEWRDRCGFSDPGHKEQIQVKINAAAHCARVAAQHCGGDVARKLGDKVESAGRRSGQ